HVEVRRSRRDGVFQDAARFGLGLGCGELEFAAVELVGHIGQRAVPRKSERAAERCGTGDELTAIYAGTLGLTITHCVSSLLASFLDRALCALMAGLVYVKPTLNDKTQGVIA